MATYKVCRDGGVEHIVKAANFTIDEGHIYFLNDDNVAVYVIASGTWVDFELIELSEHSER